MKKILLGTTTLIGAAGLFAGAALADTPKVTLGGFADFQLGYVSQDQDDTQRHHAFRSDTEVTLRIDGKMDNGIGYGGGIDLEADVSGENSGFDSDGQGFNASRTFVYLDGQWGRVQMGSDLGVTNTMKVDASSIARATGGIDGDFKYFLNPVDSGSQFIATPDLIMDYGFANGFAGATSIFTQYGNEFTENNNKITYYSPKFSGFQVGLSYVVDSIASRGQQVNLTDSGSVLGAENIWQGAVTWEGKWDQVGIALAATGEMGDAKDSVAPLTEDLSAWNVGGKLTYAGFGFAASYGDWGDSLRASGTAGLDDSWYWTVGGSYEMGPWGFSVTYLESQFAQSATTEDQFENLSFGVDYKMAPGFTPYAEVSMIDADSVGTAVTDDNDATVFIMGTLLAF